MARRTGTVNHIHKYFQKDDGLWACAGIDGCTHYMPKNMAPAPVGRMSVCWGECGKTFMLTPINMENSHPMCDACSEGRDALAEATEKMLNQGLAQFRKSKTTLRSVEKDNIEVIEPDE